MATTNTLARAINAASTFIRNAPLTGINGYPNEPAFSIGDWVRNFILAPPFAWRWNRGTTTFTTTAGTQDYPKAVANFGWIEKATVNDGSSTPNAIHELEVRTNLGEESQQNLPVFISPRLDDDAGNITFRLLPAPAGTYTITVTYQLAAPKFATMQDSWAPIPDYMYHLVQQGVLAKTYEYWNDARFPFAMSLFVKQLIANSSGLSDSQVNIFLETFVSTQNTQRASVEASQQGRAGRGLMG